MSVQTSEEQKMLTEKHMLAYGDDMVYIPSAVEEKLLPILLNPKFVDKSVKEKAELAGICMNTYHSIMKRPLFRQLFREMLIQKHQEKTPKVLDAMYEFAISEKGNATDRTNYLKITGMLEDKKTIDITKKSMHVDMNFGNMATEDIKAAMKEMLKENPDLIKEMIKNDPSLIEGIKIENE